MTNRYAIHFPAWQCDRIPRPADLEAPTLAQARWLLAKIAREMTRPSCGHAILIDLQLQRFADVYLSGGTIHPIDATALEWDDRPIVVHGTDAELAAIMACDAAAREIVLGTGLGVVGNQRTLTRWREDDGLRTFPDVTVLTAMTPARVLERYTTALGHEPHAWRLFACPPQFKAAADALREIFEFEAAIGATSPGALH